MPFPALFRGLTVKPRVLVSADGVEYSASAPLSVGLASPSATLTAGRIVSANFTPTAIGYDAGDVIEGAKEFPLIGPASGGFVYLAGVSLEIQAGALISGETSYNLEIYTATPPSAYANGATYNLNAGDRATHIATVSLGTAVDKGDTCKLSTSNINELLAVPVGGSWFAYLVTVGGFTAVATIRKATLKTVAV